MRDWGELHVEPFPRRYRSPKQRQAADEAVDRLASEFRAMNSLDSKTHTESNPQGIAQSRANELQRPAGGSANTATRRHL